MSHSDKNEESYDMHAMEWESAMYTNLSHKYLEKPAIENLIPLNLQGKSVLCIGVGSGEELAILIQRGAEKIIAIDISNQLLKRAQIKFPVVNFKKMDMMNLSFEDDSFDFIYSSLAFHYTDDWDQLLRGIHRILKKEGLLLFSTHRPEHCNERNKITGGNKVNKRGIILTEQHDILPGGVEIVYYNHVNTDALIESILYAGFKIQNVIAPLMITPNTSDIYDKENYDRLNKKNTNSPFFLIILAQK